MFISISPSFILYYILYSAVNGTKVLVYRHMWRLQIVWSYDDITCFRLLHNFLIKSPHFVNVTEVKMYLFKFDNNCLIVFVLHVMRLCHVYKKIMYHRLINCWQNASPKILTMIFISWAKMIWSLGIPYHRQNCIVGKIKLHWTHSFEYF